MKKKVDNRVRLLAEKTVAENQRCLYVIVGDQGKEQVVNLHYMLSRLTSKKPNVLWCYKKDLGFSSNRKKRNREMQKKIKTGYYDPNSDDPFEMFLGSTDIRFCFYKETEKILGKTFGMCVLQDFEALTPNTLCRTAETVEGGGAIVLLLRSMSSLKQLYTMALDAHSRFRGPDGEEVEPRFNERFILSLSMCNNCLVLDDELNVLPLSSGPLKHLEQWGHARQSELQSRQFGVSSDPDAGKLEELKVSMKDQEPLGSILDLAKTVDQGEAILTLADVISEKNLKQTVSLTAGRGRGKSAALGMAIGTAIAYGYSNIFVTAPSPENLTTLFDFVLRTFEVLGLKEHLHYSLVELSNDKKNLSQNEETQKKQSLLLGGGKAVVRINVFKDHRQTIQYISPEDSKFVNQAEILVVDEAAAIPLPLVRELLSGPHLTLLSSTVQGYEGTGRALSLKLIEQLKKDKEKQHKELSLEVPIRYAAGDRIEQWLHDLLCLGATSAPPLKGSRLPLPKDCQLYLVNRDALFSYHKTSELFLRNLVSLFVSSHYKNTPDDLLLLSDAPKHHVLTLLAPVEDGAVPEVLVAIQICQEGKLAKTAMQNAIRRGVRPAGDLLPWTLTQQFSDSDFGRLNGCRIVRVATHPSIQRQGYASEAVTQLCEWLEGKVANTPEEEEEEETGKTEEEGGEGLLSENLKPKKTPPLLCPVSEAKIPGGEVVDYVGTSFGLTVGLFNFWSNVAFKPVYIRQTPSSVTGEFSSILLRANQDSCWLQQLQRDFSARFLRLLPGPFRNIGIKLALAVAKCAPLPSVGSGHGGLPLVTSASLLNHITRYDVQRLKQYGQNLVDHHLIADLTPILVELYFLHRLNGISAEDKEKERNLDFLPPSQGEGSNTLKLSHLQEAVLLSMGGLKKSIGEIAEELAGASPQLLALYNKAIHRVAQFMHEMLEAEEKEHNPELKGKLEETPILGDKPELMTTELEDVQREDGAIVQKDMAESRKRLLEALGDTDISRFSMTKVEDAELDKAGKKGQKTTHIRTLKERKEDRTEPPKKKKKGGKPAGKSSK